MVGFFLAEENDEEKTEGVKRSQRSDDNGDGEQQIIVLLQALRKNRIFRVKTAEWRDAAQGERTDEERPKGDRHFFAQVAHLPDVLFVVHAEDDRTSTQEQQGFEKRVRGQMEHRRRRAVQADGHDHVTELGQRRISDDAFDVVLLNRDERGEQCGETADLCADLEGFAIELKRNPG